MSTELGIRLVGSEQMLARLNRMKGGMSAAMRKALSDSIMKVYRRAMANLTGRVLHIRTGRLRQSIQTDVAVDGSSARIGTNVEYARIHEYGGVIPAHRIVARRARALAVPKSGLAAALLTTNRRGKVRKDAYNAALQNFVAAVNHPGAVMLARPYLRPAISDSLEDIRLAFRRRIGELVGGGA